MIVNVTYKTTTQVSPDDWETYTEVVNLEPTNTLEEAYKIITQKWAIKTNVNVELHFHVLGSILEGKP